MALSIKTAEADALARELARRTGRTMTEAITISLRESVARLRAAEVDDERLPARIRAFSAGIRKGYDTAPVSRAEWDWASGETA